MQNPVAISMPWSWFNSMKMTWESSEICSPGHFERGHCKPLCFSTKTQPRTKLDSWGMFLLPSECHKLWNATVVVHMVHCSPKMLRCNVANNTTHQSLWQKSNFFPDSGWPVLSLQDSKRNRTTLHRESCGAWAAAHEKLSWPTLHLRLEHTVPQITHTCGTKVILSDP